MFTTQQRKDLAARGLAMSDGGYPIRNKSDLENAIQAYGRATNKPAVKKWIKKRAKDLGAEDILPDNWKTVTHSEFYTHGAYIAIESDGDFLDHHGVKGMKWGHRKQKQVAKRMFSPKGSWKYRTVVGNKMDKEYLASKEAKAYENMRKNGVTTSSGRTYRDGDIIPTKADRDELTTIFDSVNKAKNTRAKSVMSKYSDEYASATLKDLGEEETPESKDYIKQLFGDRLDKTFG